MEGTVYTEGRRQEHVLVVQQIQGVHLHQSPEKLALSQLGRILNAVAMNIFFFSRHQGASGAF